MRVFGNPFVWLARFRHRCGYGVHSPFAFRLMTEVFYEDLPYYYFGDNDRFMPWTWQFRRKKGLHLLFRLSNWFRPEVICSPLVFTLAGEYMNEACPRASLQREYPEEGKRTILFIQKPDEEVLRHLGPDTLLVLDDLHRHRKWFRRLPSVVSFDLYDLGIAFFDPRYHKQHYIVNF